MTEPSKSGMLRSRIREDFLTCTICFNEFNHPKALPCLHTFCLDCLRDFVTGRNYEPAGVFPCPVCRQNVSIPTEGLQGFPDNHMISSLFDAVDKSNTMPPVHPEPVASDHYDAKKYLCIQQPISNLPVGVIPNCLTNVKQGLQMNTSGASTDSNRTVQRLPLGGLISGGIGDAVGSAITDIQPIKLLEQEVPMSPYEFVVDDFNSSKNPVKALYPHLTEYKAVCLKGRKLVVGQFGPGVNDFFKPYGLGSMTDGGIVVSDKGGNRIFVFDQSGKQKSRFNIDCIVNGVTVTQDNNILVAVSKSGSAIMRTYTVHGKLIQTIGEHYKFDSASGIAVTPSNHIVITNLAGDNVLVFTGQRKFSLKFGWKGAGNMHFLQPHFVTATNKDYIVVADTGNNCIKLFSILGEFKRTFGTKGDQHGQFNTPLGIATDSENNIIIADSNNFRVEIFTVKGMYYTTLVESTNMIGPDVKPINVAVTTENNIAVLLHGTGFSQVWVYSWKQNSANVVDTSCV